MESEVLLTEDPMELYELLIKFYEKWIVSEPRDQMTWLIYSGRFNRHCRSCSVSYKYKHHDLFKYLASVWSAHNRYISAICSDAPNREEIYEQVKEMKNLFLEASYEESV